MTIGTKMKTLINLVVLLCFISNIASAGCDWSKDITPGPNKTFVYSEACHLAVGQLVQDNKVKTQQVQDLTKALTLKDLALTASDSRATLWSNTSQNLEDRLQKVDSLEKKNEILYFALGVLATGLSVWGASQLVKR